LPNQKFLRGHKVDFSVSATDEDNDNIYFNWTLDGRVLSTGSAFSLMNLSVGRPTMTISVSDGRGTVFENITIEIAEPKSTNADMMGILPYAVIGIVIVALMGLLIFREMKKKRPAVPLEMPPPAPPSTAPAPEATRPPAPAYPAENAPPLPTAPAPSPSAQAGPAPEAGIPEAAIPEAPASSAENAGSDPPPPA
jgi:hypothetical protein